jgi:hypothetical protein
MNYEKADALLQSRNKRKLENNTYLHRIGDKIAVSLHQTDIITFLKTGEVLLTSGGWKTITTKDRLNKYAPVSIYQRDGKWFIDQEPQPHPLFVDGMKLDNKHFVVSPKFKDKTHEKLVKQITAYCKKLAQLKEVPIPSTGDCWYCLMFEPAKLQTNTHLISHLKDKYIHGSLIVNALKDAGYQNPEVIYSMNLRDSIIRAVKRYFKRSLGIAG